VDLFDRHNQCRELVNERNTRVAVGRALLADAGWAQKIHQGRSGELVGFNKEALAILS
jgi:2,4-dienoyl-CoA reductase-like NADH-dependent reductase (Old Yellow Enzyme family)